MTTPIEMLPDIDLSWVEFAEEDKAVPCSWGTHKGAAKSKTCSPCYYEAVRMIRWACGCEHPYCMGHTDVIRNNPSGIWACHVHGIDTRVVSISTL